MASSYELGIGSPIFGPGVNGVKGFSKGRRRFPLTSVFSIANRANSCKGWEVFFRLFPKKRFARACYPVLSTPVTSSQIFLFVPVCVFPEKFPFFPKSTGEKAREMALIPPFAPHCNLWGISVKSNQAKKKFLPVQANRDKSKKTEHAKWNRNRRRSRRRYKRRSNR